MLSLDGRSKSKQEAEAIAVDVSKYQKFTNAASPRWGDVLLPKKVREYLDHLTETGTCSVDGQLTKLQ